MRRLLSCGVVLAVLTAPVATSAGTKSNAIHLMESLGITWEELDIRPAATQMLTDLGHPFGRGLSRLERLSALERIPARLRRFSDRPLFVSTWHGPSVRGTSSGALTRAARTRRWRMASRS